MGGLTYTKINNRKALANIIQLLKPGGTASIVRRYSGEFTGGSPVNAKVHPALLQNIRISEKIIPTSGLGGELRILTIKKMK